MQRSASERIQRLSVVNNRRIYILPYASKILCTHEQPICKRLIIYIHFIQNNLTISKYYYLGCRKIRIYNLYLHIYSI